MNQTRFVSWWWDPRTVEKTHNYRFFISDFWDGLLALLWDPDNQKPVLLECYKTCSQKEYYKNLSFSAIGVDQEEKQPLIKASRTKKMYQ